AVCESAGGFHPRDAVADQVDWPEIVPIAVEAEQVAARHREQHGGDDPEAAATRPAIAPHYSAALATGFISTGGAYFRSCCSEGTILRASSTLARSISAITRPAFSPPASASTSPHGATAIEWPYV